MTDLRRATRTVRWAGSGAAVLAASSALVSAYWAAGGTALLPTVGGELARLGRAGGTAVVLVLAATAAAKAVGAALAIALVHPPRRLPPVLIERVALIGGGLLAVYGGVLTAVGLVALTGVLGSATDPSALRWHALFWDPWFLVWGVLLVLAAVTRHRLRIGRPAADVSPGAERRSGGPARDRAR